MPSSEDEFFRISNWMLKSCAEDGDVADNFDHIWKV